MVGIITFFMNGIVLLVDDARTPRNIAKEKVLEYQILDLDPLLFQALLKKMDIFYQIRILEEEELDSLCSLPPEKRIQYIKEKTKNETLFSIQVLRYTKEEKEYEILFRYEWLDMENLEIISSARLKARFNDVIPIKSIVKTIENSLYEEQRESFSPFFIPKTIRCIPKKEVEEFINLHKTAEIGFMSSMFSSTIFYYPSPKSQRWKAFPLLLSPLYFSAQCKDMFEGNLSISGIITGASLGSVLGLNSIFWFPEYYSKDPLGEFLQQLGVFLSGFFLGSISGMCIGRAVSLEEEVNGIPTMKKISFLTTLGATCIGDSGWAISSEGRTCIPVKRYFLTFSSSMGSSEIDKEIYPFIGVGCGAGFEIEKINTQFVGEVFLTTPYEYFSFGYIQLEINYRVFSFQKFHFTPYLRKKIPLSKNILKRFELQRGIEIGIGIKIAT